MVEIIFLMLVLKLPILYLVGVVYWAVKAEPPPPEPAPPCPHRGRAAGGAAALPSAGTAPCRA